MKNPAAKFAYLGFVAMALLSTAPVRAVGPDDLNGSVIPSGGVVDRKVSIDQGTRWVNVDYGQTVEFVVKGQDASRQFVWRFDGIADRVNLSAIERDAALDIPIYVNQTLNPMHTQGGD